MKKKTVPQIKKEMGYLTAPETCRTCKYLKYLDEVSLDKHLLCSLGNFATRPGSTCKKYEYGIN